MMVPELRTTTVALRWFMKEKFQSEVHTSYTGVLDHDTLQAFISAAKEYF